ncbi:ABC transporter substrate-binding protein [Haloquadratum walsbyi]|uniref:ABC-type transport system periplasmic substrate-binding protein (Probable substrate branched-chain amino acids) n=1 Tax=Haloquadratum walsbyi (strain DSM 16790 / HBSQ001) TaxID=362976 RepID=Q18I59_HALWD|nr:ABC transporter substrate-binding protein [Haloquadratum walsbyi]CAJ52318.1 ABC-type transport system periplasmic substrate-binding protein (probable substrate branched-chain amino acids) [Haloquadratum walsbyi DSM 16790]
MVDEKTRTSRRKFLAASGSLSAAALAGCSGGGGGGGGGSGSGSGSDGRTLRQGYLLPLTGDLGSLGTAMRDAGMMATAQVQDADIQISVETQEEDTQTEVPAAIDGANALVNSDFPMMVGSATSNIEIGNRVFVPNGMLACSPSNTLPTLSTFDDDDLFFRTTPGDQYQGFAMAQAAGERLDNIETVATTYINDDYGQLLSQWFTKHFEQGYGGTVQEQVVHDPVQSSYSSKLQTALSGDPDLLVVITYPQSGVQMFNDYYAEFDTDRPIMLTDGAKDPTLPQKVGNSMEAVVGTMPAAAGPNYDSFTTAYEEEYGNSAIAFTAQTYDSSAITLLANAAAGENTGSAISDQMANVANPGGTAVSIDNLAEGVQMAANGEEVHYEGAASAVDFDENGDLQSGSYEIWEFTDESDAGINRLDVVDITQKQALNPGN